MFLVITGISGSGKTTIGKELAKYLNLNFLDLDSFYLIDKPLITLSNGMKVKNWDCLESLDIEAVKLAVKEKALQGLVFVGFAICDELLPIKPDYHIHLSTGKTKEEIINKCIDSRKKSKPFKDNRDELVVKEIVYPFYCDIIKKMTINYTINERPSVPEILNLLK